MAAPPDLINDPPSLICRYKDRTGKTPILFPFLRLPVQPPRTATKPSSHQATKSHQARRRSEQEGQGATFISVLERANARKGGPPPPALLPSLLLLFESAQGPAALLPSLSTPFCRFITARGPGSTNCATDSFALKSDSLLRPGNSPRPSIGTM